MKHCRILWIAIVFLLIACTAQGQIMDGEDGMNSYRKIDQETAKAMMAKNDGHVTVDVRRQDEYDSGHIPGAILIPNESIGTERPAELPDLDQIILIYCRSGNRSKQAAQKLFDLGYTNLYEFGGINTWTGSIVTSEQEATVKATPTLAISAKEKIFYATLAENESAKAFAEKLGSKAIEVEMQDYGSFEKVGTLPWTLPSSDEPIATEPGDVILYQGNKITVYYDRNTWDLSRLAKIENVTREELLDAFGDGNVTISFWLERSE